MFNCLIVVHGTVGLGQFLEHAAFVEGGAGLFLRVVAVGVVRHGKVDGVETVGVDVGLVETAKRNSSGKIERRNLEIDFVVNRHDERLYIQSAYALPDKQKMDQEQASLLNVPDGFKKVIIVGERYSSNYNEDGILMIGIYDFLLNPEAVRR